MVLLMISFIKKDSKELLALALALYVSKQLTDALVRQDRASLVVSGGSTPLVFFQQLSKHEIDWKRVDILLADERCVAHNHSDSNTKLVNEQLLINHASDANFIKYYQPEVVLLKADSIEQQANTMVEHLAQFDVVILGMGLDSHTASLFPNCPQIEDALNITNKKALLFTNKSADEWRMSMSLSRILNSKEIIIHITGQEKVSLLKQIEEDTTVDFTAQPIASVIHQQQTPLSVYYSL